MIFMPHTRSTRHDRARAIARTVSCALTLVLLVPALAACKSGGDSTPGSSGSRSPDRGKIVDPAPVIERFNARAERVTSLWARASAVIEGEDAEGRDLRERAEGHFQIIPPDRIAMSLGKLGNDNLYFGSDDTFYWWFDMIDSQRKIATVGRHASITPAKIDALGLPIDPLNLIDALGITPLPTDLGSVVARPASDRSAVVLSAPTRRGVRRYTIDRETGEPSRVELIGPGGVAALDVSLTRYRLIRGLEQGEDPLRVPERIVVRMNGFEGEIRFELYDPERKDIRPVAFRVDLLIDAYGIDELVDLDRPAVDPTPTPMDAIPADAGRPGDAP